MLIKLIAQRLGAALAGRSLWLRLKREYQVDDGVYVLLMPEDDRELNEQALRHIDDLVASRRARGVLILTDKPWVRENAAARSDRILAVKTLSAAAIDRLLSFFELYAFTERLLIVSLTRPYGNRLHRAMGMPGLTKEDVVCRCVFLLRNWSGEPERGPSQPGTGRVAPDYGRNVDDG
ncbi:MAG: hypothetical protein LBK98_00550 [Peptococcaceae bacterium]|jgi:hypothetical protein|nr:hypothetical protein [Peptococcaceae bacterium]